MEARYVKDWSEECDLFLETTSWDKSSSPFSGTLCDPNWKSERQSRNITDMKIFEVVMVSGAQITYKNNKAMWHLWNTKYSGENIIYYII